MSEPVGSLRIGLLGPTTVGFDDAQLVAVTAAKQRVVLAALALRAGRLVTSAELAEALWDGEPPSGAKVTLRNYIRRLRQALGAALIRTSGAGYLLAAADDQVDAMHFAQLCRTGDVAARAGNWPQTAEALDQALRLWRGAPLADVPSASLHREWVPHWEQLRLEAAEQRALARLQLGRHQEAAADLAALAAQHPLREHAQALLMLALYQCGRIGEALAAYRRARAALVGELGVEPGAELAELHQRILRRDSALAGSGESAPATGSDRPAAWPVPRQLPAPVPGFTGRRAELELVDALDSSLRTGTTVPIAAIEGIPGVGKTALAVQYAHRVAQRFPDGQLYVDLRGFSSEAEPLAPTQVVRGFLDALGVPAAAIPVTAHAQAGLYRSLLAGKRILVVLDNARDAAQARPLLPGEPGCMVIVTSRSQLAWLAAAEGARLVRLDVLDGPQAQELLTHRIGSERARADPDGLADLVRICAGLPPALVIVAASAAARPGSSLSALAAELDDSRTA